MFVVPDRSRAFAGADDRHIDQSDARPSRSPRDDGALRRDQGAAGRAARKSRSSASTTPIAARSARGSRKERAPVGASSPVSAEPSLDWATSWVGDDIIVPRKGSSAGSRRSCCARSRRRALRGAHNGAERGLRLRRGAGVGRRSRGDRARRPRFPGLPHRMEEVGAAGPGAVRQRLARRPTPTPPRRRSRAIATSTGSSAARPRRAASSRCAAFFPPRGQGLSDRRGERRIRHARSRARSLRALRDAGSAAERAARDARARATRRRSCCFRRPAPPTINSPISRARGDAFRGLVAQSSPPSRSGRRLMISRAERRPCADWCRGRSTAGCSSRIAMLIVVGLVFSLAGSPPVAERLHLPTFYFVNRQALFLAARAARHVRRVVAVAAPRSPRRAGRVHPIAWR